MCRVRSEHGERIDTFVALQFLFDRFWGALKVGPGCTAARAVHLPRSACSG
jgi:hypothetical protein